MRGNIFFARPRYNEKKFPVFPILGGSAIYLGRPLNMAALSCRAGKTAINHRLSQHLTYLLLIFIAGREAIRFHTIFNQGNGSRATSLFATRFRARPTNFRSTSPRLDKFYRSFLELRLICFDSLTRFLLIGNLAWILQETTKLFAMLFGL